MAGDEDRRSASSNAVVDEITAAIGRGGAWTRPAIRRDKHCNRTRGDTAHHVNEAGLNPALRPCVACHGDVPAIDSAARHYESPHPLGADRAG